MQAKDSFFQSPLSAGSNILIKSRDGFGKGEKDAENVYGC